MRVALPHYGSNRISRWLRRHIEGKSLQELVGIPLVGLAFFGAVVMPQAQAGFASTELLFDDPKTIINAAVAASRYHWPLATFGISQYFSSVHPGMDLTDPFGTPVQAVSKGTVVYAGADVSGYGKYVVIRHEDDIETLYAHLSRISVTAGQKVTKDTELGEVGATGRATGNHLHLEVRVAGASANPIEVLPELEKSVR